MTTGQVYGMGDVGHGQRAGLCPPRTQQFNLLCLTANVVDDRKMQYLSTRHEDYRRVDITSLNTGALTLLIG